MPDPKAMSQRELDEYLDRVVEQGREETAEFERAYAVWESRDSESSGSEEGALLPTPPRPKGTI